MKMRKGRRHSDKELEFNPRKKLKKENEKIEEQMDEYKEEAGTLGLPMNFGTTKRKK